MSEPNLLRFRFGTDDGVTLSLQAKQPGEQPHSRTVDLDVDFPVVLGARHDPYDRLLADALAGDASRFARSDSVEAAWRIVQPLLGAPPQPSLYPPGTWGPEQVSRLTPSGWHPIQAHRAAPRTELPARPAPAIPDGTTARRLVSVERGWHVLHPGVGAGEGEAVLTAGFDRHRQIQTGDAAGTVDDRCPMPLINQHAAIVPFSGSTARDRPSKPAFCPP